MVPNAHSAEALPNDHIVVASSDAPDGDKLGVFDRATKAGGPAGARRFCTVLRSTSLLNTWMRTIAR